MPKAVEQMVSKVGQLFDMGGDQHKDAIDLLKADHRKVESLFSQFERARSNKQNILDQIIKELSIHATVEENLVYPLIDDEDHDMAMEANEEHHVVKMMLAELADIPADKDIVKAKVRVLKEIVNHHVKEEERDILPKLKKSGADLDRLAEDILRRKQQLMTGVSRGGGVGKNKDRKAIASSATVRKTQRGNSGARKSTSGKRQPQMSQAKTSGTRGAQVRSKAKATARKKSA
jgi:hemerythrin superfamily protein